MFLKLNSTFRPFSYVQRQHKIIIKLQYFRGDHIYFLFGWDLQGLHGINSRQQRAQMEEEKIR